MVFFRADPPEKTDAPEPMKPKRRPFGQIAIEMGFVTPDQVAKALRIQKDEDARGATHRLLGIIMLGAGFLASEEMIQILKYYQTEKKEKLLDVIKKAHTPDLGESPQTF